MTYNPTYDRTDWRAVSTRTLIEAARDSGHELAIALGERLAELDHNEEMIADLQAENLELERRVDILRNELDGLCEAYD